MDTLQQAPALWYWSEPASGYSIEDCEQIVAEEMQTAKSRLKVLATVGGTLKCTPTVKRNFTPQWIIPRKCSNSSGCRFNASCHESDHTPVEKPLPDEKNNPYTAKRAVLF